MVIKKDVVVIGGGQAGLAIGYFLAQHGHDFIMLDARAELSSTWRTRYDSLRLFTPAQYNNLPGLPFPMPVDTYPTKDDVVAYLAQYVATFNLPLRLGSRVHSLQHGPGGYLVQTDADMYEAPQVVVATGPFQRPFVPPIAAGLAPDVFQIHSGAYRSPQHIPSGSVLVVGAGNSGAQIAEELSRGRTVFLSQGKRVPMLPQRFLGKDLFWWLHTLRLMEVTGQSRLGQRMRQLDPLIGTDLKKLVRQHGVTLLSRVTSARDHTVTCADGRLLQVSSVIWATGYRPDYSWINVPVFDQHDVPIHRRGVTAAPGLYFLGLPWLHRRGSALLGGVGRDAAYIAGKTLAWSHQLRGENGPAAAAV